MKRKLLGSLVMACVMTLASGCVAGPNRLSRTWDDYANQQYTQNAWVTQILSTIIPVYPIVGCVMGIGDVIVVNTYTFWAKDAFNNNKGTGYVHTNPTGTTKTVTGYGM